MARSEARIRSRIWANADWRSLSVSAQWAYQFLLSQPNLSYAGVVPLRVRRWASSANGMTVDALTGALGELERARFIAVDLDTEELLVRTLIRNDEVYRQPNLLRAAHKALADLVSPRLRIQLAIEVRVCIELAEGSCKVTLEAMAEDLRDPLPNPSPKGPNTCPPSYIGGEVLASAPIATPKTIPAGQSRKKGIAEPIQEPIAEGIADGPRGKGMVTALSSGSPNPLPLAPSPLPPSPSDADASGAPTTAQSLVADWLDHVPKRPPTSVVGQVAKHTAAMLADGIDPADVRRGIAAWVTKGLHPSALPSVVNEVMNAPANGRASPKPSTTDQRVAAALALADEYDRLEITA